MPERIQLRRTKVVDHHDTGWQMAGRDYDDSAIWEAGTSGASSADLLAHGPVTVLYVPTEEARNGE